MAYSGSRPDRPHNRQGNKYRGGGNQHVMQPSRYRVPWQQHNVNAYQAPDDSLSSYQQNYRTPMENYNDQRPYLNRGYVNPTPQAINSSVPMGSPNMPTTPLPKAVVLKPKKTETDVRVVSAKGGPCNLLELLKSIQEVARCPICLGQVSPPVSMCANGHGTCQQCRASLSVCSICKGNFLTVKPRILEQILQLLPKPCNYSDDGCETFSWVNDHEHELFCQFRPITCMLGEDSHCDWTGSVSTWEDHIEQSHGNCRTSYAIDKPRTLYYGNFQTKWISRCYVHLVDNQVFLLYVRKIDGKFLQAVRYIPNEKPTHTYYFLLTITDKTGEEIYKYKMKAKVMDKEECLENSVYCMSVPIEELDCLLDKEEDLGVTFKVTHKKT